MSVQAYEWVTMYAPIPDHAARVVLYCLADRAGADGRGAYPSSKTISEWSGIDARNVRRELKKLEQGGWIRRGHPSAVAHIPAHLRPTVWDLNLSLRRPADPGHSDTPCHDDTPVTTTPPVMVTKEGGHGDRGRGVMVTREGGHGDAQTVHEPSLQPSLNLSATSVAPDADASRKKSDHYPSLSKLPTASNGRRTYPDEFEQFWDAYPKREDKAEGYNAWRNAVKRGVSAEEIHTGAQGYAQQCRARGTSPRHIKNAQGWINGDRFNNEFTPDLETAPASGGVADVLAAAQALRNRMDTTSTDHIDGEVIDFPNKEITAS